MELRLKSRTEENAKPKLRRGKKEEELSAFEKLVKEACEISRKVESMKSLDSCRLTADALLRETIQIAGSTPERIKELHRMVDHGTGFLDSQRSLRRAQTFLEGRKWSQAPRDPRSLNWLNTEATRSELAIKGFSQTELFCCAIERAAEFSPEIFGAIEDSEEYNARFATLQKRQNELFDEIGKNYTANDLQMSELDSKGRAAVSFKLSGGDVLLAPQHDSGERLVACMISKGW